MKVMARTDADHAAEVVRRHVDDIERDRRLPPEVVEAIRATGLNRMYVPSELGGSQRPPAEMAAIVERIAAVDGSAGWCAAVGSGSNLFAGYVPRGPAAETWKNPDAANASMFGPYGRIDASSDPPTLTGRWPFVSNCLHSDSIGLGTFVDSGDETIPPMPRLLFVPAGQVTIHDTWDVTGMRGTGSHDVSVDRLPVDVQRSCSFLDAPWATGPLWRVPLFTALAPPLAAVVVGIALGCLQHLRDMAAAGGSTARGALVDDPIAMAELATADASLSAARAALYESMQHVWASAADDVDIGAELRARSWNAAQHAVDVGISVADTAHRLAGSAAVYRGHRFQRALADAMTARQHILFSRHFRPVIGKALAGIEVSCPPFL